MGSIADPESMGDAAPDRAPVTIGRDAILHLALDAVEILVENEVDHARDGIGTIDRRGAPVTTSTRLTSNWGKVLMSVVPS
jgi:hypothetical protein